MALTTLFGAVLVLLAVCFVGSSSEELIDGPQALSFLQLPKNVSLERPIIYSYRIMYVFGGKHKKDNVQTSIFSADTNIQNSKIKDLKTVNPRNKNFPGNARLINHFLTASVVGTKYPSAANGTTTSARRLSKYLIRKWHGNEASRLSEQVVLKERRKRYASRGDPISTRDKFEDNPITSQINVPRGKYYNHYFKFPAQHQQPGDLVLSATTHTQYKDPARREYEYDQYGSNGLQSAFHNPSGTGRPDIRRAHHFERSPTSSRHDHYKRPLTESSSRQVSRYDDDEMPGPLSSRRKRMSQYSAMNDHNRNSYLSKQPTVSQSEQGYPESFRSGYHDTAYHSHLRPEYNHDSSDGYHNRYGDFESTDKNHFDKAPNTEAYTYGYNENVRKRYPHELDRHYNSRPAPGSYSPYDHGYLSSSNPSYGSYERKAYSHHSEPYNNRRPPTDLYYNNRFETVRNANDYRAYEDSGRGRYEFSELYSSNRPFYEQRYSSNRPEYAVESYSPRGYYSAERTPRRETGYELPRHSPGYFPNDRDSGYNMAKSSDDYSHGYATSQDQRQDRRYNERRDDYYDRYFTSPRTDRVSRPSRQPHYKENDRTQDYPTEQKPAYPDTAFNDAYLPQTQRNIRRSQVPRYPLSDASGSGRPFEYHQNSRRFQQLVRNAKDPGKTMDVSVQDKNAEKKIIQGTFPARTEMPEKLERADGNIEESLAGTHTDSLSSHTSVSGPHNKNTMKKSSYGIPVIQKHIVDKAAPKLEQREFDNIIKRQITEDLFSPQGTTNADASHANDAAVSIERQLSDRDIHHLGLGDSEIPHLRATPQYSVHPSADRSSESELRSRLGYSPPYINLLNDSGSNSLSSKKQHDLSINNEPNQANRVSTSKFFGSETKNSEHAYLSEAKDLSKNNENLSPAEKASQFSTNIRNIEISHNRIIPRLKRQSPNRLSNSLYAAGSYLGGRQGSAESSIMNYGYGVPQYSQSFLGRNHLSLASVPSGRGFQGSSRGVSSAFASPYGQIDPHQRNDQYLGLYAYDHQPNYSPYSAYSDHQGTQRINENPVFSRVSTTHQQSHGSQTHQDPYNAGRSLQTQGVYNIQGLSAYNLPQASTSYQTSGYQSSLPPYSEARKGRAYAFQPSGLQQFAGQRSPIAQYGLFQEDISRGTGSRGQAYYPQSQSYNSGNPTSSPVIDPNNQYISSLPYPYLSLGQTPNQRGPNTFASSDYPNVYTGQQIQGFGNTRSGFSGNEHQNSYLKNAQYQPQSAVYASSPSSYGIQYPFALAKTKSASQNHFSTSSKDFRLRRTIVPVSEFSNYPTESNEREMYRQNAMASLASKIQNRSTSQNGPSRFSRIISDLSMSPNYSQESSRYRMPSGVAKRLF